MKSDRQLIEEYCRLVSSTDIIKSYRRLIAMIRQLRLNLEKQLADFTFTSRVEENRMDFAYFGLSDSLMWENGLKIFVVFVHENCCFEVWLSGRSRKVRREYHSRLQNLPSPFVPSRDPAANDYIAKAPVTAPVADPSALAKQITERIKAIQAFVHRQN